MKIDVRITAQQQQQAIAAAAQSAATSNAIIVSALDVLCGRGKVAYQHRAFCKLHNSPETTHPLMT
jgi:hypothetical protein